MIVLIAIVALIVNAALILALVRFRQRRGRPPARVTAGRGVVGRVAAGLGALALAIFVFGVVMTESARDLASSGPEGLTASASRTAQVGVDGVPEAALEEAEEAALNQEEAGAFVPPENAPLPIDAIAQQWLWRFEYPGGTPGQSAFSYGELVVPVDTSVLLTIDSTDVIHSWWVPALGGQVQAVPGSLAQTWFRADEVGVYEGRGTVFDGTAFPSLRPRVRVVEAAEYESYVVGLAEDLAEAQEAVRSQVASAAEAAAQSEQSGGTP